jgi:hypothetical protein
MDVDKDLHSDYNPYTKEKFEAIDSYDPYESEIAELNKSFHESYNQLIQTVVETLGKENTPVIIMAEDSVTLLHEGDRETVNVIPDLYHRMKAISHVSFGIYLTLADNGYGQCKASLMLDLINKGALIRNVLSVLDEEPIPGNYMAVQRKTLDNALRLIEDVVASNIIEEARLKAFGEENAPLYLENAALCAELQLDVLHKQVLKWKDQLGPELWREVHVVVCAAHQARYRETTKQYFQRLFGEEEGFGAEREDRVIYGEHIKDVDGAIDLLARHLVDQRASVDLFADRSRLQEDLMSDAAATYLEKLLPR